MARTSSGGDSLNLKDIHLRQHQSVAFSSELDARYHNTVSNKGNLRGLDIKLSSKGP